SPPPAVTISTRVAPASSAFSRSSLTTLAGRSTTSPAAIWLIIVSESWRLGMEAFYMRRSCEARGVGAAGPLAHGTDPRHFDAKLHCGQNVLSRYPVATPRSEQIGGCGAGRRREWG